MTETLIDIGGRLVGPGRPCFIVAEAGINHNSDPALADRRVGAAAESGASAIKFQTFKADRLVALTNAESQHALLSRYELSEDLHRRLQARCKIRNLIFLSTPFDESSADFLESLGVPAFKIASGDLTHPGLLAHVARKRRPMIVSTGMATLDEVAAAGGTIRAAGNSDIVLLHCVSNYPARPDESNLRAMQALQREFGVLVGFSDHTPGVDVAPAAVSMGACVIEKHFTLDRDLPGPDHSFSLNPADLAEMVRRVRVVEAALGDGQKRPTESERLTARGARKSLVAARLIAAGSRLTREVIAIKRPGTGLPPGRLDEVVGRRARVDIPEGALLTEEMFQ